MRWLRLSALLEDGQSFALYSNCFRRQLLSTASWTSPNGQDVDFHCQAHHKSPPLLPGRTEKGLLGLFQLSFVPHHSKEATKTSTKAHLFPHCSTAPASNPNPGFLFHGSRAELIIAGIREPPFAPSHPLVPVSFCPLFSTHTQQHKTQAAVSRQHLSSENEVRDDTFDLTMTERKPRGKKNLA